MGEQKFRDSLKFFFAVLRVCGLNCINLADERLKLSKLWPLYSLAVLIGYSYFHSSGAQIDLKAANGNFVTTLIDYYNKYSGLLLFVICILLTLLRQGKLIAALKLLEDCDHLLGKVHEGGINYAEHGR